MFDIGFWEIIVVLLVTLGVTKAQDIPTIIRYFRNIKNWCVETMHQVSSFFDHLEYDLSDSKQKTKIKRNKQKKDKVIMVKGNDGKYYPSYDLDTTILSKTRK